MSYPVGMHNFFPVKDGYVTAHPAMTYQFFKAQKDHNAFRIFLLGGSQAIGFPYVNPSTHATSKVMKLCGLPESGGIATWLEEYFSELHPQKKIEVVNAAAVAQDISTAVNIYKKIIKIGNPDLVIFLSGNNEFPCKKIMDSNYGILDTSMNLKDSIQKFTKRYQLELKKIISLSGKHRIKTYILTVPSNLRDFQPDKSAYPNYEYHSYDSLLRDNAPDFPIATLKAKSAKIAWDYFYMAKAYDLKCEFDSAYKYYLYAKDFDRSFSRARSAWNNKILSIKQNKHISILNMEQIVRNYSRNGIPGTDLFIDYVHFNI